jgi:pyrimidine-specific ribonucleoside hydrolase
MLLLCVASVVACAGNSEKSASEADDRRLDASESVAVKIGAPRRVWLDVDPAIGLPQGEVDDGLFLLQSFHSPEMEIAGVSVVFGNTSLENALPIARAVVQRFGPVGLEVAAGAASATQLGEETEAVRAMASALEAGPLALLAVGPVTNAATLVQLHPELHSRIEEIVMVAARREGQSFRAGTLDVPPFRDFNFELDPAAMQVLLDSQIRLVFAPWEVSSHVWLRRADLEDIAGRSEAGAWASGAVQSWIQRWQDTLGVDGFNPFDTLAAGWITHPHLLNGFEGRAWIQEDDDDTQPGKGVRKPYLYVDPQDPSGRQVTYLFEPHADFKALLKNRIAGASAPRNEASDAAEEAGS